MKPKALLFVAVLLATVNLQLLAQSGPALINYQGRLTDQTGAALAPGVYTIQFRIWDDPSATNASDLVWAQQQNLAVLSNGVFSAIIGSTNGFPIPGINGLVSSLGAAFSLGNRYLGVTVAALNGSPFSGGSEIMPRQQLLAVPYAMNGIPSGGIIMWSGAANNVPAGWALCDGNNGTPDLRDRFVVSAGTTFVAGTTNGSAVHSHSAGSYAAQAHSHTVSYGGLTVSWDAGRHGEMSVSGDAIPLDQFQGIPTSNAGPTPLDGTSGDGSSIPPCYALAFIMKL